MTATAGQYWHAIKVHSGPAVEPVTTAEIKTFLRLYSDVTSEDTMIAANIKAARRIIEKKTNRCLINQTIKQYQKEWPDEDFIHLRRSPVSAVTSFEYLDTAGASTALVASADYLTDLNTLPPRVCLPFEGTWPSATLYPASPIILTYTAGYGAAGSDVPEDLLLALKWMVGHCHENRQAVTEAVLNELPMGMQAILDEYRVRYYG